MKPLNQKSKTVTAIANLSKWRHTLGYERLNFIKTVISFKLVYNFKKNPLKTSDVCVCICMYISCYKLVVKFIWKCSDTRIANINLKKNSLRKLSLPDISMYYNTRVIKTMRYWGWKNKQLIKENTPQINSYTYG